MELNIREKISFFSKKYKYTDFTFNSKKAMNFLNLGTKINFFNPLQVACLKVITSLKKVA